MPTIVHLRAEAFDVDLSEPFGIASGTQPVAKNVLCTIELEGGSAQRRIPSRCATVRIAA